MTNVELDQLVDIEIPHERKRTVRVIKLFAEIERRKAFLEFKCTSLYMYLIKKGYEKSAAQRRKDAAQLLCLFPEIAAYLDDGEINLTQLTTLQSAFRKAKPNLDQKKSLIEQVRGLNEEQTQQVIARELKIEPKHHDQKQTQADGTVRMTITMTPKQNEIYERVKDLASHTLINPQGGDWIEHTGSAYIQNFAKTKPKNQRHIFEDIDACCVYSYGNGEKCGSRWQVQADHIIPKHLGGTDHPSNLQPLCGVHNRRKYREELEMMRAYSRNESGFWEGASDVSDFEVLFD